MKENQPLLSIKYTLEGLFRPALPQIRFVSGIICCQSGDGQDLSGASMYRIKQFTRQRFAAGLCPIFLMLFLAPTWAEEPVPWALRDHYSFTSEHASFKYDLKTAEWMVEIKGRGAIVQNAQCEIEFADGEVLRLSTLESVKDEREKFSGPMGDGTYFRSIFRTNRSLQIDYSVARFNDRPFLLLFVTMQNKSNRPIEIKAVRTVVFDPGCVDPLGAGTKVTRLSTGRRGIFPVMHEDDRASLVRFELDAPDMTLGIGLLQTGLTNSYIDLQSSEGSWSGSAECRYEPSLRIEPGMTVGSDPVWISFSLEEPRTVLQFHSWAEGAGTPTLNLEAIPPGWITIDEDLPVTALYEAAGQWDGSSIHYALVPAGWEERPGSLHGLKPLYPRDMHKVAVEIAKVGMRPGITVDPLAVSGAKKAWTVQSEDGTAWLDISNPDAFEYGMTQMQRVVGWGFQFFVVRPSLIPDEALRDFNVTRAQADSYAFQMVAQAARGLPVLPSADLTLGDDLRKWQQAASTTLFYKEYGLVAAPIRLRVDGLGDLSRALTKAIGQFAGPVEFIGNPKRKVRREIATLLVLPKGKGLKVSR